MSYHCRFCNHSTADRGNFKTHLGATNNTHNMGPFVCQVPGCNVRAARRDSTVPHPSHPGTPFIFHRDPTLNAALDAEMAASYRPAPLAPPTAGPAHSTTTNPAHSTSAGPPHSTTTTVNPSPFDPSLAAYDDSGAQSQGISYYAWAQGQNNNNDNEDQGSSSASAPFEHETLFLLAHGGDESKDNDSDDSDSSREYLMRTGVAPLFMEAMKLLALADPPVEKPLLWAGKWLEARSLEIEGVDEEKIEKEDEKKEQEEVKKDGKKDDEEDDKKDVKKEDEKDDKKDEENNMKNDDEKDVEKDVEKVEKEAENK